jgi:hypothetical protein
MDPEIVDAFVLGFYAYMFARKDLARAIKALAHITLQSM